MSGTKAFMKDMSAGGDIYMLRKLDDNLDLAFMVFDKGDDIPNSDIKDFMEVLSTGGDITMKEQFDLDIYLASDKVCVVGKTTTMNYIWKSATGWPFTVREDTDKVNGEFKREEERWE